MVQDHFHRWNTTCKCWYSNKGGVKNKANRSPPRWKKTSINQWALTKTGKKWYNTKYVVVNSGSGSGGGGSHRIHLTVVVVVVAEVLVVIGQPDHNKMCLQVINSLLAMPPSTSPQPKPAAMCSAGNCTTWNGFQISGSCPSHWWSCAQGLF